MCVLHAAGGCANPGSPLHVQHPCACAIVPWLRPTAPCAPHSVPQAYEGLDCFFDGLSNNWKLCWSSGCFPVGSTNTQAPVSQRLTQSRNITFAGGGTCAANSLGSLQSVGGDAFLVLLAATLNVYRVRDLPTRHWGLAARMRLFGCKTALGHHAAFPKGGHLVLFCCKPARLTLLWCRFLRRFARRRNHLFAVAAGCFAPSHLPISHPPAKPAAIGPLQDRIDNAACDSADPDYLQDVVLPADNSTCNCLQVSTILDSANLALADLAEQPYDTNTSLAQPLVRARRGVGRGGPRVCALPALKPFLGMFAKVFIRWGSLDTRQPRACLGSRG